MTEQNPEHLFPPKAGGMVDQARQRAAAEQTQAEAAAGVAATMPDNVKIDVPVMERGTELARARTFSVVTGVNQAVELLGRDPNRRYAVLMTLDQPVVISFSEQAAKDSQNAVNAAGLPANGFVLPVNVPVPVNSAAVIWCTATSSTPTRVSVMAFVYSET